MARPTDWSERAQETASEILRQMHVLRDREQVFSGSARFGRQLNRLRNCLVSERGRPMPTQRLSMRRIKEVLRLKHVQGLPERTIARTLGISKGAVRSYLRRAEGRRAELAVAGRNDRRGRLTDLFV